MRANIKTHSYVAKYVVIPFSTTPIYVLFCVLCKLWQLNHYKRRRFFAAHGVTSSVVSQDKLEFTNTNEIDMYIYAGTSHMNIATPTVGGSICTG